MLRWAVILFVLALIAAIFGFGSTAGILADGAGLLFVGFIILVLIGGAFSLLRRL
jgi:uncharacterized membrane protein YtjA (UPF0391 family)